MRMLANSLPKFLAFTLFVAASLAAPAYWQSQAAAPGSQPQTGGERNRWSLPEGSRANEKAAAPVLAAPAACVSATTLTFDEIPFQPVHGLNFGGVSFDFRVNGEPSLDAFYNSGGPGAIAFVQDPSLEGDAAGVLTLTFNTPVQTLSFGVARSTVDSLAPGFTVELADAFLQPIGTVSVNTSPLVSFSEGQFSYTGTPVRQAVITFNSPTAAARFALDNLRFCDFFVDVCLQDERNGNILEVNSITGDYIFTSCRKRRSVSGRGTLKRKAHLLNLQHDTPDRRLAATVNTRGNSGTAALRLFALGSTFTITDNDITDNSCGCP